MHTHARWRSDLELQHRVWPDGVVIYDIRSGDTYYLQTPAWQILEYILRTPCSESDLLAGLGPKLALPEDKRHLALSALLADLQALSLIEPEDA